MKTVIGGILAAATMSVAFAVDSSQNISLDAVQASDETEKLGPFRLVGTWRTEVTFVRCTDGTPVALPFPALNSFAAEQTSSEFGVASGNLRGPGYGTWKRIGFNQFSAPVTFFRFDAGGALLRDIATTQRTITMTGRDRYLSENVTEFRNIDGALLFTGCATEVGTWFK